MNNITGNNADNNACNYGRNKVKINMNKPLCEYKAVVFDLDGTLYFQRRLRIRMAWMLGTYYLCHLSHLKELFIVKKFREVREEWDEIFAREMDSDTLDAVASKAAGKGDSPLDYAQYSYVADKMHCSYEMVRDTIVRWMYEKPLKAVYETRDKELLKTIDKIKRRGQKVIILSDYPVEDKLKALLVEADGEYSATDEAIGELKPSPKGLNLIMKDYGLKATEVLMVGDRYSKDGLAAINAGCDYVILNRSPKGREMIYEKS